MNLNLTLSFQPLPLYPSKLNFSNRFSPKIPCTKSSPKTYFPFLKCSLEETEPIGLQNALSGMVDKRVEELLNREENKELLDKLNAASQRVELARKELAEIEKQETDAKMMKEFIGKMESRAAEIAECQKEVEQARAMVEEAERSLSITTEILDGGEDEANGIDKDEERLESVKAALVSALVGSLAGIPISLASVTSTSELLLPLAVTFASCALFGVTFRYAVRRDIDNVQLKTGTSAAFGFVKGLGTLNGGPPLELSTSSLLSHAADGALLVSQNLLVFLFAGVGLDFCFKMRLLSPFPIRKSNAKPYLRHVCKGAWKFPGEKTQLSEIMLEMEEQSQATVESVQNDQASFDNPTNDSASSCSHAVATISKRAQKKLLKQQSYEAQKAEKKAEMEEQKQKEKERKRKKWEERLVDLTAEENLKLVEWRRGVRKHRMEKKLEEREKKIQRLTRAKEHGQNIVIDLEFSHLMTPTEIYRLSQQITYCYGINAMCSSPAHLWLTGYKEDIENQFKLIPGFEQWIIEKETRSYIEALQDYDKEDLVYLTADAETIVDILDPKKIYIIGGLVDRNRWKGLTLKKAKDQGIQAAKLPIGSYLKMSSSQVLTVNQVIEILLKYWETKDWPSSFFQVIPQRKRVKAD